MLTSPTIDKLRDLNLLGMSRAYKEQMERADYQALGFDDRLGMLVDATVADAILDRLVHNAHRVELRGHESLRGSRTAVTSSANAPDEDQNAPNRASAPATPRNRADRKPVEAR